MMTKPKQKIALAIAASIIAFLIMYIFVIGPARQTPDILKNLPSVQFGASSQLMERLKKKYPSGTAEDFFTKDLSQQGFAVYDSLAIYEQSHFPCLYSTKIMWERLPDKTIKFTDAFSSVTCL